MSYADAVALARGAKLAAVPPPPSDWAVRLGKAEDPAAYRAKKAGWSARWKAANQVKAKRSARAAAVRWRRKNREEARRRTRECMARKRAKERRRA